MHYLNKFCQDLQKNCFLLMTWHLCSVEDLKRRLEAWKGALKSKRSRVKVKKTKIMISSENAGKVTEDSKSPCTVC